MHFSIVCLAILSVIHGNAASRRNIQDDLDDFQNVALTSNVIDIFEDYILNDEQVQKLLSYIQSVEFNTAVNELVALSEYQNLLIFLHVYGADIIEILPLKPSHLNSRRSARGVGVDGLLDDVMAAFPEPELETLFENKMVNSPEFRSTYNAITSPEFQVLLGSLTATPECQRLIQGFQDRGVNGSHFLEFMKAYFGVHQLP